MMQTNKNTAVVENKNDLLSWSGGSFNIPEQDIKCPRGKRIISSMRDKYPCVTISSVRVTGIKSCLQDNKNYITNDLRRDE